MPSDSRNDAVLRAGSQLGMQQSSARCREFSSAEQMNEDADEPPLGLSKHHQPPRVQFMLDSSKTASSSSATTVTMIKTPALFAVDAATTSEGSDHSDCEEHHSSGRPLPLSPLVLAHSAVSSSSSSSTNATASTSATVSTTVDDSSPSPLPSPRSPPSDDLSSSSDESSSDSSPLRSRARTDGSLGDVDDDDDADRDDDDDEYDPSAPLTVLPKFGPSLSHVNPKLEARVSRTGSGIFAVQRIEAGETLVVWTGRIITDEEALTIVDTPEGHYLLQIGDGFYQCPLQRVREAADFTNHSCNPNAGFGKNSPVLLSAIRPLEVGDEVLFDYGMCETDERLWHPMRCECGAPQCRKWITANDWKLYPELWTRYDGFWSPHVQARVDRLLGRPNAHAARQARAVYEQQHAVSTAPPLNVDAASEAVAEAAKEQVVEVVAEVQVQAAPQAMVVVQKQQKEEEVKEKQVAVVADASAPALPSTDVLTSWLDTALSWFGLVRASAVATAAAASATARA